MRKLLLLLLSVVAWFWLASGAVPVQSDDSTRSKPAANETLVEFSRDIRPILSDNCFHCHGPDANTRKADLRLDVKEGLLGKHGDAPLIVPGKPEESELYRRLTTTESEERMPPANSGKQLNAHQRDLIKRWIEQGAKWQGHWAYNLPHKPEVPPVDEAGFVKNAIDRFILAELQARKISHVGPADRAMLLRRLSLDLTGLPPTPAEVDHFVQDKRPDFYEKTVDRLLASPHYAERMATLWLDLVRFANTDGYHGDNHRDVDLYRDYVIDAFKNNKPFDQFTREQLAGDLLPKVTEETRIASGYNRMTLSTREGGAQAKEYLAKYSADRVRSVGHVWLASTLQCCECHDHKYDPYTARDFYSLASYFADIQEIPVGEQPETTFPRANQRVELAKLDAELKELENRLQEATPDFQQRVAAWEQKLRRRSIPWVTLVPRQLSSAEGLKLDLQPDSSIKVTPGDSQYDTQSITLQTDLWGITGVRLETFADPSYPLGGPGLSEAGNFLLNELELFVDGKRVKFASANETYAQEGAKFNAGRAIDGITDDSYGWAVGGKTGRDHAAVFITREELGRPNHTSTLKVVLHETYRRRFLIGRYRISVTTAELPVHALEISPTLQAIFATPVKQRTVEQLKKLADLYREAAPEYVALRRVRDQAADRRRALIDAAPKTLVSMSGKPRMIRVLPRGNWMDDSGEPLAPAVPRFLPQGGKLDHRPTRLDLANWLTSRDNPLVARVFVNRLWKLFHGQGLVKTLDDFGAQGAWPTHPQLLDWLAVEFIESGWDVKHLVRLMVTSGTYRLSSVAPAAIRNQDPDNKWLARQGRFRLDAEMIRDLALSSSGLLVDKVGGPSVKPYQPAGYWAYLNFPQREWQADHGEGLYRRSMYTYWCRTFPHPTLRAFDAPTREECCVERPRSNTPLQSLVLLNDPIFVEAARVLAERTLQEGGADTVSRLRFAYRQVLSRSPRPDEERILTDLLGRHQKEFTEDPIATNALLRVGEHKTPKDLSKMELAAWTSVARVILNLHETITRN